MHVAFFVVPLMALLAQSSGVPPADRRNDIRRAQVWTQGDPAAFDFIAGEGEFAPWATVTCDHTDKKYNGNTPKFGCAIAPGDVEVRQVGPGGLATERRRAAAAVHADGI